MKPAARKGANLPILMVVLSVLGCFIYSEDVKSIADFPFSRSKPQEEGTAVEGVVVNSRTVVEDFNTTAIDAALDAVVFKSNPGEEIQEIETPPQECDLFTGNWVFDNVTHPLYKEDECEFLTDR